MLQIQGQPRFNRGQDVFLGGLTIAVNDTAAYEVEVLSYSMTSAQDFSACIRITLYDHFGLDRPDLEKIYVDLAGFRAWFILQHIRGYRPFITVMENDFDINGKI